MVVLRPSNLAPRAVQREDKTIEATYWLVTTQVPSRVQGQSGFEAAVNPCRHWSGDGKTGKADCANGWTALFIKVRGALLDKLGLVEDVAVVDGRLWVYGGNRSTDPDRPDLYVPFPALRSAQPTFLLRNPLRAPAGADRSPPATAGR